MSELSSALKPEQLAGRRSQDFHFILLTVRARVVDDSTRQRRAAPHKRRKVRQTAESVTKGEQGTHP